MPYENDRVNEHYHGNQRVVTIDEATGWYFVDDNVCWERYGPYDAVSGAFIMKAFERDTGMQAQVGDRVYLDGRLLEITSGAWDEVAVGGAAEDEMQRMLC